MSELTRRTLGYYQLLAEPGGGGMATVYRAYDTRTGRLVALKLLLPHLCHDREFVEHLARGAQRCRIVAIQYCFPALSRAAR